MSDIAFNDVLSTNEVFRGNDHTRFLTNDLDAIEADIQGLETGKADSNHTHSDYAAKTHTHTGYAASNHNHNSAYIAKALQIIADDGDVEYAYSTSGNPDLLAKIVQMPVGIHTAYSQSGVTNNPKTVEAWRMLIGMMSSSEQYMKFNN